MGRRMKKAVYKRESKGSLGTPPGMFSNRCAVRLNSTPEQRLSKQEKEALRWKQLTKEAIWQQQEMDKRIAEDLADRARMRVNRGRGVLASTPTALIMSPDQSLKWDTDD